MSNPFDLKSQITKNPQQTRARAPHTILGHLKKPKGLKTLPTKLREPPKVPPPPKMNTLQKIGASLLGSHPAPKIPWFMRYPYRPVLSLVSIGKKGLEASVSGGLKAKSHAERAMWRIQQARRQ